MTAIPEVSLVIPAYNEAKTIGSCLTSLAQLKTRHTFEVIVVDNNSTDETAKIARSFSPRLPVRVILEKRKGRGTARAAGFAAAKGKIIFSTDADTRVPADWIEVLMAGFVPGVVGVSGPMYITDCSPVVNAFVKFIQPYFMHIYRLMFGHYWLSGFNFAVERSAYTQSGGFNVTLNAHEDIDLSLRVSKLGKIRYIPISVIASGRRLKKGLLPTFVDYCQTSIGYHVLRKKNVYLSDVR